MTKTEKKIREKVNDWLFDDQMQECIYGPPVEEVLNPRKRKKLNKA